MPPSVLISSRNKSDISGLLKEEGLLKTFDEEALSGSSLLDEARRAGAGGVYLSVEELGRLLSPSPALNEAPQVSSPVNVEVNFGADKKPLIWLIDDESSVRVTVRRWLIRLGYTVELFEQGEQLLQTLAMRVQTGDPTPMLLICDADMPEMSGIELLTRLRIEAPDIKRLLYTAREPSKWVIEAFNQGVIHRFIDKQDGPQALNTCLTGLLADELSAQESLSALDDLLREELVELYLQPIFNAQTRTMDACEALMRSKHPAFKGPLDILDATARAGRELELQKLLTKRCAEIRASLPEDITLFMNIDPVVFSHPDELSEVFKEVYPYAQQIVLELTERGQLCGEVWVESVRRLRSVGFQIALDDLGAGYNSLGAVAAVSPEIIKLDISLISQIHLSTPKREMVHLLGEYARRHGIKVVAEGIELAEEAEVCTSLDLTWLQGYFLARPLSFEVFKTSYLNEA